MREAVFEAIRVVLVGFAFGALAVVLRGVPSVDAFRPSDSTSCAAPVAAQPTVSWVDPIDAHRLWEDPHVFFVDARSAADYEIGHVTNAVHVPMETGVISASEVALVRGASTVITYCDTEGECARSRRVAELLAQRGLPDVRVLRGGIAAWLEQGFPAESGPCARCE